MADREKEIDKLQEQLRQLALEKTKLERTVDQLQEQLDKSKDLSTEERHSTTNSQSTSPGSSVLDLFDQPISELTERKQSGTDLVTLARIHEIQEVPPPTLALKPVQILTPYQVEQESIRRKRFATLSHPLQKCSATGEIKTAFDIPGAKIAPSIRIETPPLRKMPSFETVLADLGVPRMSQSNDVGKPLYFTDCRILSQQLLKQLIQKRAEHLVERTQAAKKSVDQSTQTFITHVHDQYTAKCVNCGSNTHTFKACGLPFRPGFCHICGADRTTKEDCFYPHGVEHELALNKCTGCGRHITLFCPECPDCTIRWGGLVTWFRLNYSTWPTWRIPVDQLYLVNEGKEELTRARKPKYNDPEDEVNRLRAFLIRENALTAPPLKHKNILESIRELTEEKRRQASRFLYSRGTELALNEIMELRPELDDGTTVNIIIPTKYKKTNP